MSPEPPTPSKSPSLPIPAPPPVDVTAGFAEARAEVPVISFDYLRNKAATVGSALSLTPTIVLGKRTPLTGCHTAGGAPLPAGLELGQTTCAVQGTPARAGLFRLAIVAQSDAGDSVAAPLAFEVKAIAPALSFEGALGRETKAGVARTIQPVLLRDGGDAIVSCAVAGVPVLPAGLTIDGTTCVVSGVAPVPFAPLSVMVKVTNASGLTGTAVLALATTDERPVVTFPSTGVLAGAVGQPWRTEPAIAENGAAVTGCHLAPGSAALPEGIRLEPSCVIAGTPVNVIRAAAFTVVAESAAGDSVPARVVLTFAASAPVLDYTGATGTSGVYGQSLAIEPVLLVANGAEVVDCAIAPNSQPLPPGVVLDRHTCAVSGVPAVAASATTLEIVATNVIGSSAPATLVLTVAARTPTLSYAGTNGGNGTIFIPFRIAPALLDDGGAPVTHCALAAGSPALPQGLAIDDATCTIAGTPLTTFGPADAFVEARNAAGASLPARVTIKVAASPPALDYNAASTHDGTIAAPFSVVPTMNPNGSAVTSCVLQPGSPALPAGLIVEPATCAISGTPTVAAPSQTYRVIATNAAGSSPAAPVAFAIAALPPQLAFAPGTTTGTVLIPLAIAPVLRHDNGSPVTACGLKVGSAPLPAGLVVESPSCTITGTPSAVQASVTVMIQASSAAGVSAGAAVSIAIGAPALTAIDVTPVNDTLPLGQMLAYEATGRYSNGTTAILTTAADWNLMPGTGLATIDQGGLVTTAGGRAGSVSVTARVNGVMGTAALTIGPATLQSIAITPANAMVPLGLDLQLTARGTYSDGSQSDLTSSVTWSAVAGNGSASITPTGLLKSAGGSRGNFQAVAALASVTAAANMTVGAPIATALTIHPNLATVPVGESKKFTAIETYSDGSTLDVSAVATWSVSGGAGTVAVDAQGLLDAGHAAPGNVLLRATHGASADAASVTIAAAGVQSLRVTVSTPYVRVSAVRQMVATATMSDGSTRDVTATAAWTSSAVGKATVSAAGVANGVASGTAVITATTSGVSASVTLTIFTTSQCDGAGTIANPFVICDLTSLNNVRAATAAKYSVADDIDASPTATWNAGAGFDPIAFDGTVEGNGHTIRGLVINRPSQDKVALFASMNGTVRNLTLADASIRGHDYVGALAGYSVGTMSGIHVTGTFTGRSFVGALAGRQDQGSVKDVHANASINNTDTSGSYFGGLIGYVAGGTHGQLRSYGTIVVNGSVTGGLFGQMATGTLANASSAADVTAAGDSAGGLLGIASGTVSASYATGTVTSFSSHAGGLIGYIAGATVTDCYAVGKVFVASGQFAGGFCGETNGTLSNTFAGGSVISGGIQIGGLCGYQSGGSVSRSYATGDITGNGYEGGLFGQAAGATMQSFATVRIRAKGDIAGGLIGYLAGGTVADAYATGSLELTGTYGGGLAGLTANANVSRCYARGDVSARDYAGGLIGGSNGNTIQNVFAMGGVANSQATAGGLLGRNESGSALTGGYWLRFSGNDRANCAGAGSGSVTLCAFDTNPARFLDRQKAPLGAFDFAGDDSDGLAEIWSLVPSKLAPVLAWQPAVQVIQVYGLPSGSSGITVLDAVVAGDDLERYRFKVGGTATDCANAEGYGEDVLAGTRLRADIFDLQNGIVRVCVIGKDRTGTWQSLARATTASWTKASTVASLAITPRGATKLADTEYRYRAVAIYSDGTTSDVTEHAAWSSSNPVVAAIDDSLGHKGIVAAASAGSAGITATVGGVTASAAQNYAARGDLSQIPSLQMWLKADAITGIADGDAVPVWMDASGHANDAAQTASAARPTLRLNRLNGLPVLYFDGSSSAMTTPLTVQNNYSVFIVFDSELPGCGDKRALTGDAGWFMGQYNCVPANATGSRWVGPLTNPVPTRRMTILAGTQKGGAARLYLDGNDITDDANPATGNIGKMALGSFGGYVAEVIVFNDRVSSVERTQITNYLKAKYDL